ncbi:MAG: hypothetical protein JWL59_2261 [Chthoniobacteraceae bacterium]|nr:hypothetical protein [Chthoniobacteraceae bacterium]
MTRLRIAAEHRKLSKAETELGLLGWQQVDFDRETQRDVDKIQNYEREQSRLTNEGAAFGRCLRELLEKRDLKRRQFTEARRQLIAERRALIEPIARIQKQLVVYRKQEPQYERRIPELDRELREVQRLYTSLLSTDRHTAQTRDELVHLRERTVSIPNEKADLRTQHMRTASEIKTLEGQLLKLNERSAELDVAGRELEAAYLVEDRDLANEIRVQERGKARLEKEIDALEGAKANPYQQIGRVLADNGLAPMNQPHALDKVRRFRLSIEHLESKIALSLEVCSHDDPELLRISYSLWAGMIVVLIAVALIFSVW